MAKQPAKVRIKKVQMRDPAAQKSRQAAGPNPRSTVHIIGAPQPSLSDLYHFLVRGSWWRMLGMLSLAYLGINLVFGSVFWMIGGVANARPDSFLDAFFFSVETLATIGYGNMYPASAAANWVMTIEALVGMLGVAVITGLVFAKFSRPRARIIFSRVAVISPRNGIPTLMFRVANERSNYVAEATMRVAMLLTEVTEEGETLRRTYDITMMRSTTPAFILTWQGMHQITAESPLFGKSVEQLRKQNAEILVSVMGMDETIAQMIHARHVYTMDDLRWGERLADVMSTTSEGVRSVDYRVFHDTVPLDSKAKAG